MKRFLSAALHSLCIVFLLASLATTYFPGPRANALSALDWKAGRIIDDAIFFNKNSMTVAQIQQFLNAKVPVCDTNHNASFWLYGYWNAPPYTCIKDYQENGKSAAQIIWDAGQSYGINPQALIVILQKETGLITDTWAAPWQYKRAVGYKCPDSKLGTDVDANQNGCYDTHENFTAQINGAAYRLRDYVTYPDSYNFKAGVTRSILYNPDTSCGSSNVYITNSATAALYNYTPYQPNRAALASMNDLSAGGTAACGAYGNRNFFWYFNKWFGSTTIGSVPSPLYKSTDTQQIFAVFNLTKYLISSPDVLVSYGLDRYPVPEVSGAILNNFATGTPLNSSIAKKAADPSGIIYFFDGGKRFPITIDSCKYNLDGSQNISTTWGLDCFNSTTTLSLPNEFIDNFSAEDIPLSPLAINNGAVWKMENGKKRRITNASIVDANGGWGKAKWMQDYHMTQPEGKLLIPNNTVVKFSESPQIYVYSDASLSKVNSPDSYYAWRLNELPLQNIPAAYNISEPLPISPSPLSNFVKDSSDKKFMVLTSGNRAGLDGASYILSLSFDSMPDSLLTRLPITGLSTIFRSPSGSIFTIENNKRLAFPTFEDIYYSGLKLDQMQSVPSDFENAVPYAGYKLSPGRLVKVAGDDTIRYIYSEGASLAVYSTKFAGLPYSKLITVDLATGNRYPIVGTYH